MIILADLNISCLLLHINFAKIFLDCRDPLILACSGSKRSATFCTGCSTFGNNIITSNGCMQVGPALQNRCSLRWEHDRESLLFVEAQLTPAWSLAMSKIAFLRLWTLSDPISVQAEEVDRLADLARSCYLNFLFYQRIYFDYSDPLIFQPFGRKNKNKIFRDRARRNCANRALPNSM